MRYSQDKIIAAQNREIPALVGVYIRISPSCNGSCDRVASDGLIKYAVPSSPSFLNYL